MGCRLRLSFSTHMEQRKLQPFHTQSTAHAVWRDYGGIMDTVVTLWPSFKFICLVCMKCTVEGICICWVKSFPKLRCNWCNATRSTTQKWYQASCGPGTYLACTYQMLWDGNHVSGLFGLAEDLLSLRARGLPSFEGLWAVIPCVVRKKNSGFSGPRIRLKRPQEAPEASNKYLHMTLCPRATRSHLCSPSDVQRVLTCQSTFLIAVSAWPWNSLC